MLKTFLEIQMDEEQASYHKKLFIGGEIDGKKL